MVNVNAGFLQGDAHLLEMPDGKKILIDACGNNDALLLYLKKRKITHLDQVLISHMHKDHYGGLLRLIESGVKVGEIRMTIPSRKICDEEIPWGCDWKDITAFESRIQALGVPQKVYNNGETLYHFGETRLEVIAAYQSHTSPVGAIDVNDTSAVLKLTHGRVRALFTGDLNNNIGMWLANNSPLLRAEILKVPHHGTESVVPNIFFDVVRPRFALVPSPTQLWLSKRSERIRSYFSDPKILTYVNGMSGDIKVTLNTGSLTIDPEFDRPQRAAHFTKYLSE